MKTTVLLSWMILELFFFTVVAQQPHSETFDKKIDSITIIGKFIASGRSNFNDINWDNYSTSFINPKNLTSPIIVTAIPYNGTYSNFDDINAELDMSFDSSIYRFRSNFSEVSRQLYTYDSSEVYFLVPGIYRTNANAYQYRLLLNGKTIIQPWQDIRNFADSSFALNNFKKGMAFLGGYKTTWNNYILLELKRKESDSIISAAVVYWKPVKPVLLDIYTADELNSFLARLKRPYDKLASKTTSYKWETLYKPGELDTLSGLPKRLLLNADQDNIIFYLQGDIYQKAAIEYQLVKNGNVYIPWKPNDFDNNFIWLKDLSPGEYHLQMRFRAQRHNISFLQFYIKPFWYQRAVFKFGVGAFVFFLLFLSYRLWKQMKKTIAEKKKKEKLNLELKALRSQLNPHFVFNALSSIQGLVNKNDLEAANHYLTEFSSLLRGSLNNRDTEYMPLGRELKILETYIKLEQLRFHFQYTISVEPNLAIDSIEMPSLLLQPLIENAIKHGAGPKYEKGLLKLRLTHNNNDLLIDIADNGQGFVMTESNTGFGLQLVKDRIQLLNESLHRQQILLSFDQNSRESSMVHLIFKNWL